MYWRATSSLRLHLTCSELKDFPCVQHLTTLSLTWNSVEGLQPHAAGSRCLERSSISISPSIPSSSWSLQASDSLVSYNKTPGLKGFLHFWSPHIREECSSSPLRLGGGDGCPPGDGELSLPLTCCGKAAAGWEAPGCRKCHSTVS